AYSKTRDALHPAILMAPPLMFVYCASPILLNSNGGLLYFFSSGELGYVALVYLLTIIALYAGLLHAVGQSSSLRLRDAFRIQFSLTHERRKKILQLSIVLGVVAVGAFWYMIYNVGGFVAAYSGSKGGGWADSGYIGEAPTLAYPAILLWAISRQGKKLRV